MEKHIGGFDWCSLETRTILHICCTFDTLNCACAMCLHGHVLVLELALKRKHLRRSRKGVWLVWLQVDVKIYEKLLVQLT
jgi:hypothetical protein